MATGKKSFVLYSDQKELFMHLTDEQSGRLIKHIFKYVNDDNPTCDDAFVNLAFLTIKNTLKRDLEKWDNQIEQRSKAGKLSALKRKSTSVNENQRALNSVHEKVRNSTDSVSVSVSVSDNVNDNVNINDKSFNYRSALLSLNVHPDLVSDWLRVRKTKKATNTKTSFDMFLKEVEKSGLEANECVRISVERSWSGFKADWVQEELKNNKATEHVQDPLVKNVMERIRLNEEIYKRQQS